MLKNDNKVNGNQGLEEKFWKNIVSEIETYSEKGCYEKVNTLMSFFVLKRLRIIASALAKGSNIIIDVGNGPGTSTKYIKGILNPSHLIAMDPSFAMNKITKDNIKNISVINGMAENIPVKSSSIDAVIAMFSFRDVRNYDLALREFSRVLKENGKLIILDLYKPETVMEKIISFFQFNILAVVFGIVMGCGRDALLYPDLHKTIYYMYNSKEILKSVNKYFKKVSFKKKPIIVGILWASDPRKDKI
ncbi:methylase involved in ubiquinone/menaquinone biosynthesis [Caldisphaera lagunensis DSM 15908]|uniref:Methylase involved in ubiquinone/menaquinone biosynthesis n=1 Tax=Caldisphaera lagunensis (strain DSM 15908 / JCM 11604 / ANMR 0165 / IC-154) TaxID=1056495 RepID=L0ADL5_CALLD|nr:methyltransferase domain-containing protein [Caldisphaera lagunensis]AFZ71125.1 methylase involved in ubiquinone/menaquinone biosynthesis [Caldisphaera lagunensis DSM 15908]